MISYAEFILQEQRSTCTSYLQQIIEFFYKFFKFFWDHNFCRRNYIVPSNRTRTLTLPLLMTAFLSPKISASSMKCVVNSRTLPRRARCRIRQVCLRDTGSTPAVGSSSIII